MVDQFFLQQLTINGHEVPPALAISMTYIETADMSGPQLLLVLRDGTGTLIDNVGIKKGSVITASLGDPSGLGGVLFNETFTVIKAPAASDQITIMAFSQSVFNMKTPAVTPRYFKDKPPIIVLNTLAPGLKISADCFRRQGTYHLNTGQKPSQLFREIARDHGALLFSCRGALTAKSLTTLAGAKPAITYEVNNPAAEFSFSRFSSINSDDDDHNARYVGYSMTDGYKGAQGEQSGPISMHSIPSQGALNNQNKYLQPKFDAECIGNGQLTPGLVVGVKIFRYDDENRIDESVPAIMIVSRVAHHVDRFSYMCRAVLGVVQ